MKRYELYGFKESGQTICYGLENIQRSRRMWKKLIAEKKIITYKIKGVVCDE